MSHLNTPGDEALVSQDHLAAFVAQIEKALREERYQEAADLIEGSPAAAWFGMQPPQTVEILKLLVSKIPVHGSMLQAGYALLMASAAGQFDNQAFLATLDTNNAAQMFLLAMFRMSDFRVHGRTLEALEQSENLEEYLGKMHPTADSHDGWALQTSVQTGISAMLAGDFTRALTAFTRAQMHPANYTYAFLTRDALVKAALIHAGFGNGQTARAMLARAEQVPRTSSWAEAHIDAHHDIAKVLAHPDTGNEALPHLESISLNDIGEMWPFYIVATHRVLEAAGDHDELEHRLEMFDGMPFPRVDGDGFSGSVVPLKRALLSMRAGRNTEAQKLLDRADARLPYTQLYKAVGHIYAGRPQQAIQLAVLLRPETRGYRLLEIRRLAVLASAHYQAEDYTESIAILADATDMPHGLSITEMQLFSPETRKLARERVETWPTDSGGASTFLTDVPKPGRDLTERELQIVEQLAQGHTRAQAAANLFISVNTLKTQQQSIYRKLNVSSATDAVLAAQRRGFI